MKTVLLTGATGFLGSHLLEALLTKEYKVVILKRSTSNTWRIEHLIYQVTSYDIDTQPLELVFEEHHIDVVIHLATLYRKFDNGQEVADMINANVTFPTELLELGLRNGIKAFINTGTFFEYDCSQLPVKEGAKIKPFNLYAKTKLAFEMILKTYSNQIIVNTFRLFTPYGEKDNQKLIPMIIQKALLNKRIELSDGLQKMDFIYIADVVDVYLRALKKMTAGDINYRVFNIGSGVSISVREVISIIEQQLGKTVDKIWGSPSSVDIPIVLADISRALDELGWSPKINIHDGMSKTIQYYKQKGDL